MALATHPHVLKKCQAEVDSVVGPDRLPTYDDEADLPYIKATVRESTMCLRSVPTVERMPRVPTKPCSAP